MTWFRRDSQASASAQVSRRDQKEHQEKFLAVRSEVKINQQRCKTNKHCSASSVWNASSATPRPHHCPWSLFYTLSKYHLSPTGLVSPHTLSQHVCLSWLTSFCQSVQVCRCTRNDNIPPEVFWYVSFYGDSIYWAQLHNISWTMSLAKNPSSHVFPCVCFNRTTFHLCLFQQNIPSRVCRSLSPVSALAKCSFTSLP